MLSSFIGNQWWQYYLHIHISCLLVFVFIFPQGIASAKAEVSEESERIARFPCWFFQLKCAAVGEQNES